MNGRTEHTSTTPFTILSKRTGDATDSVPDIIEDVVDRDVVEAGTLDVVLRDELVDTMAPQFILRTTRTDATVGFHQEPRTVRRSISQSTFTIYPNWQAPRAHHTTEPSLKKIDLRTPIAGLGTTGILILPISHLDFSQLYRTDSEGEYPTQITGTKRLLGVEGPHQPRCLYGSPLLPPIEGHSAGRSYNPHMTLAASRMPEN